MRIKNEAVNKISLPHNIYFHFAKLIVIVKIPDANVHFAKDFKIKLEI